MILGRLTWMDDAACINRADSVFFPDVGSRRGGYPTVAERHAKRICARCPVRRECLDWALRTDGILLVWPSGEESSTETAGIFGGTTQAERDGTKGTLDQRIELLEAMFRKQVRELKLLTSKEEVA